MNNRILGTIAMILAPTMLLEAFVPNGNEIPLLVGTASMLFMAGAFCSLVGLWRVAATGKNWWGRGVLGLQLLLVTMAFLFGFFEATQLVGGENPLFLATDLAWPLSMVTMNLVGITAAVVGRLAGWRRWALLPCGLALPLTIVLGSVLGVGMESTLIGFVFFGMLALFWGVMGFVVRQSEPVAAPVAVAVPGMV